MNSLNIYISQKWSQLRHDLLIKNSAYFFANTLSISLLSGIFWWIAAQYYKVEIIGLIVVLISTAQLITTTAQFGLSFSIIRYLPFAIGDNDNLINTAFTFSTFLALILSLVIIVIGPRLSSALLPLTKSPYLAPLFLLLVLTLVLFQLITPILASLRAVKILFWSNIFTGIGRIIMLLIVHISHNSSLLLSSFIFPTVLTVIIVISMVLPKLVPGFKPKITFDKRNWNTIRNYSITSYFTNILHDLPYQLLPQIIAIQFGLANAAYFYITWNIFSLLTSISNSISLSLFVEGSHKGHGLSKLTNKSILYMVMIIGLLALILNLIAKPLLNLFGSDYFNNGIDLLRIVSIAAIPTSIVYARVSLLRVKKELWSVIAAFLIIAIISLFVPRFFSPGTQLSVIGWVWLAAQLTASAYLLILTDRGINHDEI